MLARKAAGQETKLAYRGHLVTENRNGLVARAEVSRAHGKAEVESALKLLRPLSRRRGITVGADRGYDNGPFVRGVRQGGGHPHVAQRKVDTAIDARTTRHAGYGISQRKRKRIEEVFGWMRRPLRYCERPDTVADAEWNGCSCLRQRPTTWSGCENWRRRAREAG